MGGGDDSYYRKKFFDRNLPLQHSSKLHASSRPFIYHVMNRHWFDRDVSLGTNLVFYVTQESPRDFERTIFSQWHSSKGRNSPRTTLILM